MSWIKITAQCDSSELEVLEAIYWSTGAVSVTVEDAEDNPIYEPGPGEEPLWDRLNATGLYMEGTEIEPIKTHISNTTFDLLSVETLGDKIWEREWLTRFKPVCFGDRLWVCPTGHTVSEESAVVMSLDPGLAFGTGTHATTRMCLSWLDQHIDESNLSQPFKVLDFGCGSGILGIGALLLGAKSVTGVDNDPQALVATIDNAERNHIADKWSVKLPDQYVVEKHQLVIANILAQPLVDLSELLLSSLAPGGDIVLSGIMKSQSDWVQEAYPIRFESETEQDGWVCLHGKMD